MHSPPTTSPATKLLIALQWAAILTSFKKLHSNAKSWPSKLAGGSASGNQESGCLTVTQLTLHLFIRLTKIHEHFNGIVSLVPSNVFSQGLLSKNPSIDVPFLDNSVSFRGKLKA